MDGKYEADADVLRRKGEGETSAEEPQSSKHGGLYLRYLRYSDKWEKDQQISTTFTRSRPRLQIAP